jgi:hypothetical protein
MVWYAFLQFIRASESCAATIPLIVSNPLLHFQLLITLAFTQPRVAGASRSNTEQYY